MASITRFLAAVLLALAAGLATAAPQDEEEVREQAHKLHSLGRQQEALTLLEKHLAEAPEDSDVRVLYGLMLSWAGRYDAAREQLEKVLTENPYHGDALPALINVEIWSNHPERAELLTRRGLRQAPGDPAYLLARARALQALRRHGEAVEELDRLLAANPQHREAEKMREGIAQDLLVWQLDVNHSYEWFSKERGAWNETQYELQRRTRLGTLLARLDQAFRFGQGSRQVEADFYPRLSRRSYAYFNAGFSPDATLYPIYRLGAEIYQTFGPALEGSVGYRRLGFGDRINLFTLSLGKYHGNWLFTGRGYLVAGPEGTPSSWHFSARHYFGEGGSFADLRYGRGAFTQERRTLNDIQVLEADSFAGELNYKLRRRWRVHFRAGYSREDRVDGRNLGHSLAAGGVSCQF